MYNLFADEWPLTPLYWMCEELDFNPWHFFGYRDNDLLAVTSNCDPVQKEHAWQAANTPGRMEMRKALNKAEQMLARHLKYDIAPKYRSDTLQWPRLADRNMQRWGPFDADGRWLNMRLPVGQVQACGVEARTLLQAGVAVTYSDSDGDGINDKATIGPVVVGTITNPAEVAVYYVTSNRVGGDPAISERWRIQPLIVTFDGLGNATIIGGAYLFAPPTKYEDVEAPDLLANDPTNFVSTVDVYRRYTDINGNTATTSQATITWETRPCHGWWCICSQCQNVVTAFAGSPYDPAAVAQAVARVALRDAQLGKVAPAESVLDTTTGIWAAVSNNAWSFCSEPDRVTIRSYSGYPLDSYGFVDPKWRRVVVALAVAELGNLVAGCSNANSKVYYWYQDLAKTGADPETYAYSDKVLLNPFGTRRGHVYAWQYIDSGEIQRRPILVP